MKRKGLLVEIKGNKGILLTPDGDFVSVRLPEGTHSLGSEILADELSGFIVRGRPAVWAAVAVLLLALFIPAWNGWIVGNQPVIAYVSVDVNPSVEFGVGADGRVWRGRSLNQEGDHLLSTIRYVGKSLPQVLTDLAQAALEQGYIGIDEDGIAADAILVVAVPAQADQPLPAGVQEALRQGEQSIRQEFLSRQVTAQVQFIQHDRYALHEKAEAMQLSMGRYLLLLEARRKLEHSIPDDEDPVGPPQQTEEQTEEPDVQVVVHEPTTDDEAPEAEPSPSIPVSPPANASTAAKPEQAITRMDDQPDGPDDPKTDASSRKKDRNDDKGQAARGSGGKEADRSRNDEKRDDRRQKDDEDRDNRRTDSSRLDLQDIRQGKLRELLREHGLELEELMERMRDEYDR